MLLLGSLQNVMRAEVTSVCVRDNIENVGLPCIDYVRFVFPVFYTLTSLPAKNFLLIEFPHCFCTTIPILVNCLLAEIYQDTFLVGEGGVYQLDQLLLLVTVYCC